MFGTGGYTHVHVLLTIGSCHSVAGANLDPSIGRERRFPPQHARMHAPTGNRRWPRETAGLSLLRWTSPPQPLKSVLHHLKGFVIYVAFR